MIWLQWDCLALNGEPVRHERGMELPKSTLVLLVTCSRDETRRDLACAVLRNIAPLLRSAGLEECFMVFDNASTYRDHLELLPPRARYVLSPDNIGYWSAIEWVLAHHESVFHRPFEFLYIIESDLLHSDLRRLGACESFLRREPRAAGVRTQEFSVRWRWRFDKQFHRLPFHVTRSEVSLHNAVTGDPIWFELVDAPERIFLSNFHPKLPALNRLSALRATFVRLAAVESFTENDFCSEMMAIHPLTGVLDGGIFHSMIDRTTVAAVSGSYSSEDCIRRIGYLPTRSARLVPAPAMLAAQIVEVV